MRLSIEDTSTNDKSLLQTSYNCIPERRESNLEARVAAEAMLILLLTSMLTFVMSIQTVSAEILTESPPAIVSVAPLLSQAEMGESFSIDLTVSDVVFDSKSNGLYSWQIELIFDPAIVEAVSAFEGPFLQTAGDTIWPRPQINNTQGSILMAAVLFPPFPPIGALDNGVLATVTFRAKNESACLLHICRPRTKLSTVLYSSIQIPIDFVNVDGYFHDFILVHNINTDQDFLGIQQAIAAPETLDGHTILVDAGTFYDNVQVYKSVNIVGTGPSNTRIIANDPELDVFQVTSDFVTIRGLTATTNAAFVWDSILLRNANHCSISDAIIDGGFFGIRLIHSSYNSLVNVTISADEEAISFSYANSNVIAKATVTNCGQGIGLYRSQENNISENNVSENTGGIWLTDSSGNSISENTIADNEGDGIGLVSSSNNILRRNVISGSRYNFVVLGAGISDFVNDVDTSNTVNGKPICYLVNKQDLTVPSDAGFVALVNCTRIAAKALNLSDNGEGVLLISTTDSRVIGNNIADNWFGIWAQESSDNLIARNNIADNWDGVYMNASSANTIFGNNVTRNNRGISFSDSSNNIIYHNNFVNNGRQAAVNWGSNSWDNDYPSGGNYWSDYIVRYPSAQELDDSGIWDTPYMIGFPSRDNYPLMEPWAPPTITATVDLDPDTLNLKSKGKWITAYIRLPEDYDPEDIDVSSILLNATVAPVLDTKYDFVTNSGEYLVDYDSDGVMEHMVKFDKASITSWIYQSAGMQHEISLTITGELTDGTPFKGTDIILVVHIGGSGGTRR
jgi:parallel beta-helix repeat protein